MILPEPEVNSIISKLLVKLGINNRTLIHKKFGKNPPFYIEDILKRILEAGPTFNKEKTFKEVSKDTSTIFLRKVFGNISPKGACSWYHIAIRLIDLEYCCICDSLVSNVLFKSKEGMCISCIKTRNANYYQNNKAAFKYRQIKRNIQLNLATPIWEDLEKMNIFYKNCPKGRHVDHIIPLQNHLVCGLHTLNNLQYLLAKDNISKGNKYTI